MTTCEKIEIFFLSTVFHFLPYNIVKRFLFEQICYYHQDSKRSIFLKPNLQKIEDFRINLQNFARPWQGRRGL